MSDSHDTKVTNMIDPTAVKSNPTPQEDTNKTLKA
jgi:hypothetical protein